jgi:predicted transcriptional regulator
VPEEQKRGNKFNTLQRQVHRARVAELYNQGKYQHEIAAELGVSQQQVSYDLKVLNRFWEKTAVLDIAKAKLRELAKIDHLERTYWEAWERSMTARETKQLKKIPTKGDEKLLKQETRDGNPQYLEGVQWCITKRSALLGLDKIDQDNADAARALAEKIRADIRAADLATMGAEADDPTLDTN